MDLIRKARSDEASFLSSLAMRSKAYWPYDPQLLENYRPQLEISPDGIDAESVYVFERNAQVLGFYALSSAPNREQLTFLFIDPAFIGQGYGKRLWVHALNTARNRGWASLTFFADQYAAEAFYQYQGCEVIGSQESDLGLLMEMRFDLR